jgi:hypothetical protein
MYNTRKKGQEDIVLEPTPIWSCTDENCNGWMRANFVFATVPVCPQCQSEMIKGERMLAAVTNTSPIRNH